MVTQRKGGQKSTTEDGAADELTRSVPLQAVLLADSFTTKFRPITLDRPKVLLPLVNVPMIDYALSWLESAGVEEVFLFCCAHSRQVAIYLENSNWLSQPNFSVKPIESHNSTSAGDALRFIYEQNVIHGDFVLISGDTVSNMSLTEALQEHKERKKRDSNAVMTMVVKKSKPSQVTHLSRLGTDELYMVIDPSTKQLLYYEDKTENSKGIINLDKAFLIDNSSIILHNDMQDCYIDICSPEVLSLFADNFDYQHLRRHFVKGLLVDDIMGYKIFTHEIHSSYAARIDNFRSYDIVSKDIIHRWTYPFVPDFKFVGNSGVSLGRQGMYRASEVGLSRSAQIGPFTVIGKGTNIGDNTEVSNSVIGEGCNIGAHVLIQGSYIWNNVTIEDGCELRNAIVCDGVIMKSGAVLEPGVILSFKVVIGEKFVVPSYSGISLHQQPTEEDSDEELEYADHSSGTWEINSNTGVADRLDGETLSESSETQTCAKPELGNGGVGYIHPLDWRLSVAPIPADKLAEIAKALDDDLNLTPEDNALTLSGELKPDSNIDDSEDHDNDDFGDSFDKEVEGTFLRAVHENIKIKDVFLEVNALRLSYNTEAADCAGALFHSMMKLALKTSGGELIKNVASIITVWGELLKFYLPDIDEEIEVILKLEEMCFESAKEYAPIFTKVCFLQAVTSTIWCMKVLAPYLTHKTYAKLPIIFGPRILQISHRDVTFSIFSFLNILPIFSQCLVRHLGAKALTP